MSITHPQSESPLYIDMSNGRSLVRASKNKSPVFGAPERGDKYFFTGNKYKNTVNYAWNTVKYGNITLKPSIYGLYLLFTIEYL